MRILLYGKTAPVCYLFTLKEYCRINRSCTQELGVINNRAKYGSIQLQSLSLNARRLDKIKCIREIIFQLLLIREKGNGPVYSRRGINVFYFHGRGHDLFHGYHHFHGVFDRVSFSSFVLVDHHGDAHVVFEVDVEEFRYSFPSR